MIKELKNNSGKNINIAVLDSGISKNKVLKPNNIVNGFKNNFSSYIDKNGHGTSVTNLIQNISKDSIIYNVKIFNKQLTTNDKIIIDSIKWCINNDIDLINLSTAILDFTNTRKVKNICNNALENNTYIIASADNKGRSCLPAYLDSVLGVGMADVSSFYKFMVDRNGKINIYSRSNEIKRTDKYNQVFGTSFATANMTGIISLILEEKEIFTINKLMNHLQHLAIPYDKKKIIVKNKSFNYKKYIKKINFDNNIINMVKKIQKAILISDNFIDIFNAINYKKQLQFDLSGVIFLKNKNNKKILKNYFKKSNIPIYYNLQNIDSLIKNNNNIILKNNCSNNIKKIIKKYSKKINLFIYNNNCYKTIREEKNEINIKNLKYSNKFIESIKKIETDHIFKNDKPIISLIDLTSIVNSTLIIQLKLNKILKRQGYKIGNINNTPFSQLFDFEFYYDQNIIKKFNEKQKYIFIKSIIEIIQNQNSNIDLIFSSIKNNIFPKNFYSINSQNLMELYNITTLYSMIPDYFVIIINDKTKLKEIKRNIAIIKNVFETKNIIILQTNFKQILNEYFNYNLTKKKYSSNSFDIPMFDFNELSSIKKMLKKIIAQLS